MLKATRPVSLSDHSRTIILGSILGDGSLKIHTPYKNARFSFRHSVTQKDYFDWKVRQLAEISSEKNVFEQPADGFGTSTKLRFQSRAMEVLTELHLLTHKRGKLNIRRKWLNQMTPLSLAIWWLDDGSLIGNGRKGVICTDGFNEADQRVLAQYLHKVWGVRVKIGTTGRRRGGKQETYYRLWFQSTDELKKFLRIILPQISVESMLSKVLLLYRDPNLQQRWISEVVQHTGFSHETVTRHVNEKKRRWKAFRE